MDVRRAIKGVVQDSRKLLSMFRRLDREAVAAGFLRGEGIEIGALHNPLEVPSSARVRYVDRMTEADLRRHYPELHSRSLVHVDVVDDGETLATIPDGSQDFVIANHFLEHCQNPILAVKNFCRVIKNGGVLYLCLPDKRFTFDEAREVTPFDHMVRDFNEGPAWSREQHFQDWTMHVEHLRGEPHLTNRVRELMAMEYSIHFHVWDQTAMFEFVRRVTEQFGLPLELELFLKYKGEAIFILRKTGEMSLPQARM